MAEQNGNADGHSDESARGRVRPIKKLDSVTIRFAGDSGDGMQLTGTEFTRTAALYGNDIATFPDFPAEIRAPAGSLAGVSGFQLQFSSNEIFTAGDAPDVLVAMNPAALRTNLPDLERGGLLIVNTGAFKAKNLENAGYTSNPLEDGSVSKATGCMPIDFGKHVTAALHGAGLSTKEVARTQNFFALGLLFWLYDREPERELDSIHKKFTKNPAFGDANVKVFKAGYHLGETLELFDSTYSVPPARLGPGHYRNITGNEATALGLVAASKLAGLPLLYASYPITPASDVLHNLASYARYGVSTFQAEDEIAAVAAAIGASFGGSIGVTGTSGPGFALKQEAIGLAVAVELPLVIVNVQRAGPSTGMPTKTEQADLLQAIVGRNGESPIAVVAPATPAECFDCAVEAVRLAIEHMCPVAYLSDGSLANGAEPWRLPDGRATSSRSRPDFRTDPEGFAPFLRDERLVRAVGDSRHARPRAPHRRDREGGRHRQHLVRPGQPRAHGPHRARRRSTRSPIAFRTR